MSIEIGTKLGDVGPGSPGEHLVVLINFFDELKRLAPIPETK